MEHRRQIERGFDEKAAEGGNGGGLLHFDGFGIGDDPGEAQVKAEAQGALGLGGTAGKAVHDAAGLWYPVFGEDGEGIFPGLSSVDDDRFAGGEGDGQLAFEDGLLGIAGCVIVVIVEPDFTESEHLRMAQDLLEPLEGIGGGLGGVVRVNAGGSENAGVFIGQADGGFEIRRAGAGADGHHACDAAFPSPIDDGVAIDGEAVIVEVTV
ncbi:MAG: hypothetical protein R2762_15970 [Bryobacteraceae bacterium]